MDHGPRIGAGLARAFAMLALAGVGAPSVTSSAELLQDPTEETSESERAPPKAGEERYETGALRARGSMLLGRRYGRWEFFGEDGRPDEALTGEYLAGELVRVGAARGKHRKKRREHKSQWDDAIQDSLRWLVAHQSPDGAWDVQGFSAECGKIDKRSTCSAPGTGKHSTGVTGLALLALLARSDLSARDPQREPVLRGVHWLLCQQDARSGLLGPEYAYSSMYNHAIATQALCEAFQLCQSEPLRAACESAVGFLQSARNRGKAWRYAFPPNGENDTSVTVWVMSALAAADDVGIAIDPESIAGGITWIDEMSDPDSGRVGYVDRGGLSARAEVNQDAFPRDRIEAMTAAGLWCRILSGQNPKGTPLMQKHVELLRRKPPVWEAGSVDSYFWYYGALATCQFSPVDWTKLWKPAIRTAVLAHQARAGDERGSWDASQDVWGHVGGRVMMTALLALCLQTEYRYPKLVAGT